MDSDSVSQIEPFLYTDHALPNERRVFSKIPTETLMFAVPTTIQGLSRMKNFYIAEHIYREGLISKLLHGSWSEVVHKDLMWIFTKMSPISSDTFGIILHHDPQACLYNASNSKWIKYFAPGFPVSVFDQVVETSRDGEFSWASTKRLRHEEISSVEQKELFRNLGLSAESVKLLQTKQCNSLMIRCINPHHVDNHPSACLYRDLHAFCFKCKQRFTPREIYLIASTSKRF
jgi:hypothetical protein